MIERLSIYKNKKVLITGNTGFKGSWMSLVLLALDAEVFGYSLEAPTTPSMYEQLGLKNKIKQYHKDIRSIEDLQNCIKEVKPDIIFHLAAQPLVRDSYTIPIETFDTNVMGTANLLESVRNLKIPTKIISVTSDKCYENQEWLFGYREVDPLGGYDPYSASKGAAEIVVASYKKSFFAPEKINNHGVQLASVRAGNVIGGGDWAKDRIVPDCIRSLSNGKKIYVRNPYATRPWQHVLEPVCGYLLLGAELFKKNVDNSLFCDGFNFGPNLSSNKPVSVLVSEIIKNWGEGEWTYDSNDSVHEASLLNLTIDKAYHLLNWLPAWDYKETIKRTVDWYKLDFDRGNLTEFSEKQIQEYFKAFAKSNLTNRNF